MITRWISENECTGCGVCISACEQSAIHIRQDNKGFYVPIVDDNCIECERCKKVCESRFNNQKKENKDYPKVFASWSIDENIRFISTSGGVVSELSKAILMKNGYVVGAVYGDNCFVYHDIINDIGDISRIQQSKYVQSFCDSIYEKTKKLLEKGFYVLFCGTPCQIAALKAYLSGEEYPFLFTLDFICMGVNSPLAYKLWLSGLEGQFNKRVVNVWFKYKEKGWRSSPFVTKIRFDDGEELVLEKEKNDYMRGFVDLKLFLRNSCSSCSFKGEKRISDFTVGDFWGIVCENDLDLGISMLMINNEKAETLLDEIKDNIYLERKTIEDVRRGNRHFEKSVITSRYEELFYSIIKEHPFNEAIKMIEELNYSK